ncbi:MAG: hypothetical protein KC583_22350 [Myxococcales bacterium]|nr:hypothetical protein [Myxococcales bacterium]
MKIVCLVQAGPPMHAFVQRVHARHPIDLLVVEHPPVAARVQRLAKEVTPARVYSAVRARVVNQLRASADRAAQARWFGNDWHRFPPHVPRLDVADVNDAEVVGRLRSLGPDVLLDHGTTILRAPVLESAPTALNLHWGLSPYYRGTHCTDWALINWDPLNIGVTVHRLARAIDGGGVLGQARAEVRADDTVHSLNMQLTALGTDITVRALDVLAAGGELVYHQQTLSDGFLKLNRQFTADLRRHVDHLEEGGLGPMLKSPGRPAQPIVELSAPAAGR